jgi:hypothetical protein
MNQWRDTSCTVSALSFAMVIVYRKNQRWLAGCECSWE